MPRLLVNPGSAQQWEIPLKAGANTLGRSPACDGQIEHDSVSSTHCQVFVNGEAVSVKDLGSTNGTFLNRNPIQEAVLAPGQRLQLGGVEMELIADPPRSAPVAVRVALATEPVTSSTTPAAANPPIPPRRVALQVAPHESAPPPPSVPASYVPDEYSVAPEGPVMCKYHPKSAARYLCTQCLLHYCELCVATRSGGERTGRFCRRCSGECVAMNVQLIVPVDRHANFYGSVPGAFAFPFKGNGAYVLVAGTIVFTILDIAASRAMIMGLFVKGMGLVVKIIVIGYMFAFLQKVTHTAAQGSDEPATWPDLSDISQDIIAPFFQLLATFVFSFGPALALLLWAGIDTFTSGAPDVFKVVLGGAAILGGVIYFPMAILAVTMLDTVMAVNPILVIPSILGVIGEYVVVLLIFGVILAARVGGAFVANFLYIPVLSELVLTAVGLYFFTVQMRMLGLMYYARREKLGWFSR